MANLRRAQDSKSGVPAAPQRRRRWHAINFEGLGFIVFLAVLWQILHYTIFASIDNIASTTETLSSVVSLAIAGPLLPQIWHTLSITLIGWAAAVLAGAALGIWLGLSHTTWRYSMASIEALRSIPSIAFVPLAILVFGFSGTMEFVIVVYVCIWPVLIAAINGIRNVSAGLIDTAQTLNLGRWHTIRSIILPASASQIIVGMRISLALAIALSIIAEMLGNPEGLGFGIVFVQRAFRPGDVFAYLLVAGVIGWLLNALFTIIVRRFFPGFAGSL